MGEAMEYNLGLAEKHVTLKQADGTPRHVVLRELPGDLLEAYMEENKDRMDTCVTEDGKVVIKGVRSYRGMFTSLLKRSLYDEQGVLVTEAEIKAFPGRVQQALFKDAQELNALTPESGAAIVGN